MRRLFVFLFPILFLVSACKVNVEYPYEYKEAETKIITYRCAVSKGKFASLENLAVKDDDGVSFSFDEAGTVYLKLYLFKYDEQTQERTEYRIVNDFSLKFKSNNPVSYFLRGETKSTNSVYTRDDLQGTTAELDTSFSFLGKNLKTIFIRIDCPENTDLNISYALCEE